MTKSELFVANNLEKLIQKSGMTKKAVAELKGVTPETLSRHMHGKIQLTLHDAEEYARILNSNAYEVLFAAQPIPILGRTHINVDGTIERSWTREPIGQILQPTYINNDYAANYYTVDPSYLGPWFNWNTAVTIIDRTGIERGCVLKSAIQHNCYVELEEEIEIHGTTTKYAAGILYPEPGNTYTLYDVSNSDRESATMRQLKIKWAAEIVSTIYPHGLKNCQIIWE